MLQYYHPFSNHSVILLIQSSNCSLQNFSRKRFTMIGNGNFTWGVSLWIPIVA
jgi:hypothetical protein